MSKISEDRLKNLVNQGTGVAVDGSGDIQIIRPDLLGFHIILLRIMITDFVL